MNELPNDEATRRRDPALLVWLAVAVAAAIVLTYLVATSEETPADRGRDYPLVGVKLSVVAFEPLTGAPAPLERDALRGKVSLINYWGPWCHFCRKEMPHLLALQKKLAQRDDFRLVLVSNSGGAYDDVETLREETAEYMKRIETDQPTYHDPHSQSLAGLAREAKLPQVGFPITVVLDRQGVLRGLWLGFREEDAVEMEQLVQELLESNSAASDA